MPTQALTSTPVNVVTSLSLETDQKYTAQADTDKAGDSPVHVTEGTAAPTDLDTGIKIPHLQSTVLEPDGTNGIWAWVPEGVRHGILRIEKAP